VTVRPVLHLICGMVGAGKTTLAKAIEQESGAIRFSPDEWLLALMQDVHDRAEMDRLRNSVEALQWTVAQSLLRQGVDVVLENGFWGREERLDYCAGGQALGARVLLHLLELPRDELVRRVAARNRVTTARSLQITEAEIDHWLPRFERPDAQELAAYDEVDLRSG
jgi:predicted kinase